jgi:alpha-beta hydrolase superfamily lysophospholipase
MANASGKGWSARLTRTIVLRDGTTLATLADVRTFILNEPDHIQEAARRRADDPRRRARRQH